MSTWTSERRRGAVVAFAACLGLVACDDRPAQGLQAPATMAVAGGDVTVSGPRGYCVDTSGSRDSQEGAFVLLAACDTLVPASGARAPEHRAVLSAAVAPAGSGPGVSESLEMLADYFSTEAGRAVLSRSGDAQTVTVLSASTRDGALVLHLRDTSVTEGPALATEYWRALLDIGGRPVTLSVLSPASMSLEPEAGMDLLQAYMQRMRRANRSGPFAHAFSVDGNRVL